MKSKLIIFFIIALILPFGVIKAEVNPLTVSYLLNGPQDAWVTQGLAGAGQTNLNLSYLSSFQGNSANDYSKTILALVAANEDPYNYNGTDFVAALEGFQQNSQIGDPAMLSDDFWAVLAFRSAGKTMSDPLVLSCKDFILTHQNDDGGWSYAVSGTSDTNDTAAAIMALLDAGLNVGDAVIQSAVSYLHSQQNLDGGFSFTLGGESDSGSDAWVIASLNKLGENPANWAVGENNLLSHLQSLMLADGSFTWVASNPASNTLMTAYAAMALSGSYYPVEYFTPSGSNLLLHHLRIEGQNSTYCDEEIEATTALNIIENGASVCGYTYVIEQTAFGPYLTTINGEAASGLAGWLYRVNWLSPPVGAADYQLASGDEVLWHFGEWGIQPLRISFSASQVAPDEPVMVTAEYFNEASWQALSSATVYGNSQTYQTNNVGQVSLTFSQVGSYEIYAEKSGYIRSPRLDLLVGSGLSQVVNLTVNVNNPGGSGNNLSFLVNVANLNFGALTPGSSTTTAITITNSGNVPLYLEATVSGDNLFRENLALNQEVWEDYSDNVNASEVKAVEVNLTVPPNFTGNGQRLGTLIFWASGS